MAHYEFGPDVATLLAGARWVLNLRGLYIDANAIGDAGVRTLREP